MGIVCVTPLAARTIGTVPVTNIHDDGNQLAHDLGDTIEPSFRITPFHDQILALDITQ